MWQALKYLGVESLKHSISVFSFHCLDISQIHVLASTHVEQVGDRILLLQGLGTGSFDVLRPVVPMRGMFEKKNIQRWQEEPYLTS